MIASWWSSMTPLNQVFYGAAFFFSAFFVWQFIAALIGLSHDSDFDAGVDADADMDVHVDVDMHDIEAHAAADAAESVTTFHLVSLRSVLAFFTMFFWAGAMYMDVELPQARALGYALLWGAAGMVIVAVLVNLIRRLAETGTGKLATAVGTEGSVYMNIPAGGQGQVRVDISGATSYVGARCRTNEALNAGAPIRVVRTLGPNTVEVEPLNNTDNGKEQGE